MTVPTSNAQRRRHSSATIADARTMSEGGWTAYAIAGVLTRRGTPVDERTVMMWIDDEHAARRRREQALRHRLRNARKTGGRLGAGPPRSPEFRFERMRSLRALGVAYAGIAAVMTFDFPDAPITEEQVRHALRESRIPRVYRNADRDRHAS